MKSQIAKGVVGFGSYGYAPGHRPPMIRVSELAAPSAAVYRHLAARPPAGLSSDAGAAAGIGVAAIGALIALAVAINYQLGKAMAPSKAVEARWAWGAAIGGTLLPPVIPVMAIVKNYF